jgi:hypothetical protein
MKGKARHGMASASPNGCLALNRVVREITCALCPVTVVLSRLPQKKEPEAQEHTDSTHSTELEAGAPERNRISSPVLLPSHGSSLSGAQAA